MQDRQLHINIYIYYSGKFHLLRINSVMTPPRGHVLRGARLEERAPRRELMTAPSRGKLRFIIHWLDPVISLNAEA